MERIQVIEILLEKELGRLERAFPTDSIIILISFSPDEDDGTDVLTLGTPSLPTDVISAFMDTLIDALDNEEEYVNFSHGLTQNKGEEGE